MKANSESSQRNVLSSLVLRQQGCINPYRRNLNILKTLICKSNFTFKKVWEKQSKKAIACERSRIYFNNYRESYSRCGPKLEPLLDYVLNCPAHWKIEDALVCQLSSEMPAGVADSDQRRRFRSSLFTVTSSNALTQFDLHQGTVLETIYLSDLHIFRSLQWETEGHIIAVKSTQRAASDVLFAVALFDVYPLRFLAMMEVTKSVFGRRVTGISVSQGLLITMHAAGRVTIYSLQHILEQKKDVGSGDTNDPRLNIQLSEAPPVLFEVKCAGHLMEIGGSPWHCLFSPPRREGTFLLTNLATKKQAENGLLNFNSCNIEPHRAVFHPDESGRIIHIGDSVLRVHRISSTDCNKTCVEEDFTIDVSRSAEENDQDNFLSVTKSGRIVKKRVATDYYSDSLCVNIEEVDYENELDLLCVTSVHHDNDLLGKQSAVYTGFYDNLTGKLLKEIALECSWDSYYEHNVSVDLDTIVQTVKPKLGMFRCLVYRLVRQHAENG